MNSKIKLVGSVLAVLFIGIVAAFDTGVFIKNYEHKYDDKVKVFNIGEVVNLTAEDNETFTVNQQGLVVKVPKLSMIKLTHTAKTAKVIDMAELSNGDGLVRYLIPGEELTVKSNDDKKAFVVSSEGAEGYVDLKGIELVFERNTSFGVSTVDKRLYSGNDTYNLIKGYPVKIVGFNENQFTLIDETGKEFKAEYGDVEVTHEFKAVESFKAEVEVKQVAEVKDPNSQKVAKILASANAALGTPYVWGATGPNGYDCSGFVYSLYLKYADVKLSRTTYTQIKDGVHISLDQLMPGDLVFFNTGGGVSHVGIYAGDNQMIHASSGSGKVVFSDIYSDYYGPRIVGARRVILD